MLIIWSGLKNECYKKHMIKICVHFGFGSDRFNSLNMPMHFHSLATWYSFQTAFFSLCIPAEIKIFMVVTRIITCNACIIKRFLCGFSLFLSPFHLYQWKIERKKFSTPKHAHTLKLQMIVVCIFSSCFYLVVVWFSNKCTFPVFWKWCY